MLAKSHRSVSETALLAICTEVHLPLAATLCLMAGTYFGSTAPDMDQPTSKLHKVLGPIGRALSKLIKHRTWTHSIWAIILVIILAVMLPAPQIGNAVFYDNGLKLTALRLLYYGYSFGYFMHIFEDSFSTQGICWTYPLRKFNVYYGKPYKKGHKHFWNYKTGGSEETFIRYLSNIIFIILSFLAIINTSM